MTTFVGCFSGILHPKIGSVAGADCMETVMDSMHASSLALFPSSGSTACVLSSQALFRSSGLMF